MYTCISNVIVFCVYLYNLDSEEDVQKFTGKSDPIEVLRVLRKEKDNFKKPKEHIPPHVMLALEWGMLRPKLT